MVTSVTTVSVTAGVSAGVLASSSVTMATSSSAAVRQTGGISLDPHSVIMDGVTEILLNARPKTQTSPSSSTGNFPLATPPLSPPC